ncbi:uncharacterized protein [Ptychodera flava]|uniref:uncharacterized protein n=1 Tax=Ptychodera flava TaxID=63121 RepID=UPI00396A2BC3
MKLIAFFVCLVVAYTQQAKIGPIVEFEKLCHVCLWTDLESCKSSEDSETCADNQVCTTRYRLINDDGDLQVKKGCKSKGWAMDQPKCLDTLTENREIVVGETCLISCDEHMCNSQDMPLVKGPTSRSCYQCGFSSVRECDNSDLCPMSEAACATQVKFTKEGEKRYKYKCVQKHNCHQDFVNENHRKCGQSPDDAFRVSPHEVCNYCTSDVDADNSNP